MSGERSWIGVDLDGTLAVRTREDIDYAIIGPPVPRMTERVAQWLCKGKDVRIFTARVNVASEFEELYQRKLINEWCQRVFGRKLETTSRKDGHMLQLWDDRAVGIIRNTGERADGKP
jgi:hypothetical protein